MAVWYDIIEPHEDIQNGHFDEAIFAADLGDVAFGKAPIDYNEPAIFFKKTYFTEGILKILFMVHNKLEFGKGPSVVEIKTPFGGGKTHALISIFHFLKNGSKIKNNLPTGLSPIKAVIAVVVGTHLNPVEGNAREGIRIRTLWGEIAYQLGGKKGYKEFQKNDEERISPGKEKLRNFLEHCEPFIILFDETLEYITKAKGVEYQGTNLSSQTHAFFQELTETVASLKKGMLIVTLPSSYLEDYNEKKEESLAKLEKTFGRIESIETTVKGEEIYSIIQRRLFSEVLDQEKRDEVILNYIKLYQKNKEELPVKAKDSDYRKKMTLAYPFHPEVIDILNEKWGTFSSFQRTRGVLRLLANVVEDLYNKEKNIDIILPSDIELGKGSVRQEFLKHIGNEYESIIGSDISGHDAKSIDLDKENKNWKHLAERISTSVFLYSFSGDKSEKGASLENIKFSTMHLDTIPSLITEVLQRLDKSLWYLNEKGEMYRFSKIPNLNRMVLDKKELYNITFKEEMRNILVKEIGNAFSTILWPGTSEDIPDNKDLKLVILQPTEKEDTPKKWLEKRGNTFRTYKNTIIFALADPAGFGSFKEEVKTYKALQEIEEDIKNNKEMGLSEKSLEITQRIKRIRDDFSYNSRRTYNLLLIGNEKISLGQPTVGKESLSNWYKTELLSRERIVSNLHYRFILSKFVEGKEYTETKVIIDQFMKDSMYVVPESIDVIRKSIQQGILEGAFGLAYRKSNEIDRDSIKFQVNIPIANISFDEGEVLLPKNIAQSLINKYDVTKIENKLPEVNEPISTYGKSEEKTKQLKNIKLRIENIPSSKIADLSRGVLIPISREIGAFTFSMEITINHEDGISESTLQNKIKETIQQIGAVLIQEESKG